jgi:dihydrofolate reductase
MRNIFFAINTTIDGYCSHTDMIADDDLHEYLTVLLRKADVILYGRKTYELMVPYWPDIARDQSETPATNEFARIFDRLDRIVFSTTLKSVEDNNTRIVNGSIAEEVLKLKQRPGKDIAIGSLSIASPLIELGVIDAYYIVVHPVVAGKGPRLFESDALKERLLLKLTGSETFRSGAIALHYQTQPH